MVVFDVHETLITNPGASEGNEPVIQNDHVWNFYEKCHEQVEGVTIICSQWKNFQEVSEQMKKFFKKKGINFLKESAYYLSSENDQIHEEPIENYAIKFKILEFKDKHFFVQPVDQDDFVLSKWHCVCLYRILNLKSLNPNSLIVLDDSETNLVPFKDFPKNIQAEGWHYKSYDVENQRKESTNTEDSLNHEKNPEKNSTKKPPMLNLNASLRIKRVNSLYAPPKKFTEKSESEEICSLKLP
jgi:hypothetical protein